ncbi:F-box/LRR-repeat protein [Trifolium repens]|nr:F-box/LRR-repeat protein [Trifolium repens]
MSKSVDEVIMVPPEKRARHDNEYNQDRLSDLPDCVLLHILSFFDSKHAVETCVLSTRWNHLWKHILILHSRNFTTVKKFATFVSKILTLRDTSTALHALDLYRHGYIETPLLKNILNYRFCYNYTETLFPKSLNLPLLTSLDLTNLTFCGDENGCAEPFSAFTKLNSLVIHSCKVKDTQILSISSETLLKLNLDIPNCAKVELSTPSLSTFNFPRGLDLDQKICGSGISSVKQVNINAANYAASAKHALVLLSWLQDLANVESLTVTSITLQILSLVPDLFKVKLSSLCNLKSLEVELIPSDFGALGWIMQTVMLEKAAAKSRKEAAKLRKAFKAGLKPPPIPDGIIDFLRQNSPLTEVNIITKYTSRFNLKQVEESIKGRKNTSYHSHFAAPVSSSAVPSSAAECASAAAHASAAPPNLHLCCIEKTTTNVDHSDSTLWPDFVTKTFIDIMVDEVTKGNMPNGVFHTGTWTSMTTSEEVWQNYLKTHDKASQFQKKRCDHYKLLEIIFNQNNETEVLHDSSVQDQLNTDIEHELNNQYLNIESVNNAHVDNDSSDNDIQEERIIRSGKQKIQVKDHTSMKESTSHQVGDALVAHANIVEASSSHVTRDCSLTNCVVALEEIKDISDDIFGKALEKFKDPDWREMFIAMSNNRRRGWLFRF